MRRLVASLVFALALLATIIAPAWAATPVTGTWSRTPGTLTTTVAGGPFAGVWRIDLAGTGTTSSHHVILTVETSDVAYVTTLLVRDGTRTTRSMTIRPGFRYCDATLGLCIDARSIVPPAGASRQLRLAAALTARGRHYTFVAAVREARGGPFLWGGWIATRPAVI